MDEWGNSDDTYETFGADSYDDSNEFSEGYQITGIYGESEDAIDAMLAQEDRSLAGAYKLSNFHSVRREIEEYERAIDAGEGMGSSANPLMNKATAGDLQLGRISHMQPQEQQALKNLIGKTAKDFQGLHDPDMAMVEHQALIENFENLIEGGEGSAKKWASQINIHADRLPGEVSNISPEGYVSMGVKETIGFNGERKMVRDADSYRMAPSAGLGNITGTFTAPTWRDERMAKGLIGEGAGRYMDRGPGGMLPGNDTDIGIVANNDAAMQTAMGYARELTGLYISDTMKAAGGTALAGRMQAVHDALVQDALDGVYGENSGSALRLPGELRTPDGAQIPGLRMTRPYGKDTNSKGQKSAGAKSGTQYLERIEFEQEAINKGWVDKEGNIVEETKGLYWSNRPDPANTFFGHITAESGDPEDTKALRKAMYARANDKFLIMRDTLRRQMPTTRDETKGNELRMSGWDRPYGDQAEAQYARDEAARAGIEGGFGNESGELGGEHLGYYSQLSQVLSGERESVTIPTVGSAQSSAVVGSKLLYPTATITEPTKTVSSISAVDSEGKVYYPTIDGEREVTVPVMGPPRLASRTVGVLREDHLGADMLRSTGSEKGGMYGERDMDDMSIAVEQAMEQVGLDNLIKEMPHLADDFEGIPQRTPEWYKRRSELDMTASQLLSGNNLVSVERLTKQMDLKKVKKKLGGGNSFSGNYYTAEGNRGEEKALRKFLSLNKQYTHKEVGLIENPDFPGMGVSPDGKLYDDEGNLDSLLELKFLGNNTIDKTEKYDWQMQMQMMVAGVDKTVFFALNRDNLGDYRQRTVYADKAKQKQIQNLVETAVRNSNGKKTAEEVKAEMMFSEEAGLASDSDGQDKSFEGKADVEAKMTTFGSNSEAKSAKGGGGNAAPSNSVDLEGEKNDFVGPPMRNTGRMTDKEARDKAIKYRELQEKEAAEAARERAKADKEAAKATKEFRTSLKTVLGGLAGAAVNAGESGMDTVRAAAMAGFSAEEVRGTEFALVEQGNLTESQARNVINQAAKVQATFNDPRAVGGAYSEMFANWESRGLGKSLGALPSMGEIAKSGIGYVDMVQGFLNQAPDTVEGRKDRAWAASIMGVPELAISDIEGDVVRSADGFDSEGLREFNEGVKSVQQSVQTLAESLAAASGQVGGMAAAGTQTGLSVAPVLGAGANVVSGLAGGALATGAASVLAKGATAALAAGPTALAAGAAVKGGISAAALAAGPTALAAGAAGLAVAGAGAVGYGAGSLISEALPQGANDWIGEKLTEIAAAVGVESAQVSLDRMESVGSMSEIKGDPVVSNSRGGRSGRVNNTNVTVNVDPDMVRTIVDQDGDQYMDQEMIHGS